MTTTETKELYASESGHFYWPDGRCAYTVPYKDKKRNGEERPTTLKDARELGLLPSVSGILGVMGKGPALLNWCKRQVAATAYALATPGEMESHVEWVDYVLQRAEDAITAQRDKGSRDHGIVEEYFRVPTKDRCIDSPAVKSVLNAFHELGILGEPVDSEKSFACDLGYGGKIDIIIPNPKNRMIVDFKFVDRLNKKKDYVEKVAQGAAYLYLRWGNAGLRDGRFVNIFVSTETYEYEIREWTYEEIQNGWEVFESCLRLWKAVNKYDSSAIKL